MVTSMTITAPLDIIRPSSGRLKNRGGNRLIGIEGLRGLAAASVLIYHVQGVLSPASAAQAPFGFVGFFSHGVTLFFVLSGFLLFRPFIGSLLGTEPPPSLRSYFVNRALRIMPGYVCVLLLTSLVLRMSWMPRDTDGAPVRFGTTGWLDTLADLVLVQGYFPRTVRSGLEVAWTLGVEVAFYVALPLLVMLALTVAGRRANRCARALVPPVALLLLGIAGKLWWLGLLGATAGGHTSLGWGANWTTVVARSLFEHADLFAYGMFAAILFTVVESSGRSRLIVRTLRPCALAVAALVIVLCASGLIRGVFTDSLVAVACSLLLLATVTGTTTPLLARFLEMRMLRRLGILSFSVYLWHLPVLRWLQQQNVVLPDSVGGFLGNLVLVGTITLALASLTYRLIEAPALRLKSAHSRRLLSKDDPLST